MKFTQMLNQLTGIYGSRKNHEVLQGWSPEVLERFHIGIAEKGDVFKFLETNKVPFAYAENLGLIRQYPYGMFRETLVNRIIFPHVNLQGDVLLFSGKAINPFAKPDFLRSNKPFGEQLLPFGFYQSFEEIKKTKTAILVETIQEVLDLQGQGLKNVIGTDGRMLSDLGINSLVKIADTIQMTSSGWRFQKVGQKILAKVLSERGLTVEVDE